MSISKKEKLWSYRAGGVYARDARAAKDPQQVPKHRSKKDTKRWCLGKQGREHKLIWVRARQFHNSFWMQQVCEQCGKHFQFCWPFGKDECVCGFHGQNRKL